ncbi:helicase-like transcription factor [Aplochiton taeniatus]
MFSSRRGFSWGASLSSVDRYTDGCDTESLSQAIRTAADEEPDADGSILFGNLMGNVVGLRYYSGVVNRGEMVALVRKPQNPYDHNAVMVANVYGSQVGHIKRELAAPMANIMDNKLAKVEGVVPYGAGNKFNMPVQLSFWGKEEHKDAVLKQLGRHGFKLLKNAFDRLFEDLAEGQSGDKEAAEAVCTHLLPHQKQALSWMCVCENSNALPPFWQQKGELYYNNLTYFSVKERPQRVRGGILADDMGLGKTLTTIALILTNFHNGKPLPLQMCVSVPKRRISSPPLSKPLLVKREVVHPKGKCVDLEGVMEAHAGEELVDMPEPQKKGEAVFQEDQGFAAVLSGLTSEGTSLKKATAKKAKKTPGLEPAVMAESLENLSATATLIICPLSVISNWLDQFEQHVRIDVKLNVYLYYGAERNRKKAFLSSQDVVITTYNVLSADYANKSPLHGVNWLRVVLDEGHVIRNPKAQMSKAVLALNSQRRWILSGTPIQNSLKDLWMLLAFLRLKPFDVKEWWNRVIQRPVMLGDRTGLLNLQTLVKCITLRRTKASEVNGRPLVTLPEKSVCVEPVEFTQQEREEYELARAEGRNTIRRYVAEGSMLRNYADVLAILMRLRQHCCHPHLLAKASTDLGAAATPAELRECLVERLRLVLASGSDEECSVCLDSVRLPVITHCAHVYCQACIAMVIRNEQEQAKCPLCRGRIKASELVEFPQDELEDNDSTGSQKWRTSSKVEALMANLLRLRSEDDSIKSLVVSQFTRFLTLLETPLREHGFSFVRLDGTMAQKRRAQVIEEFQNASPDSPAIMLLSLKAGGVGLNLTAASQVYLMEPAWNPAAEEQCVDRCHRLGQKKNVFITKFIVKDSVEENMVKIQRQKQDVVEKAFGSGNNRKTSRIDDITVLMEL